jgi:hypothetical protein
MCNLYNTKCITQQTKRSKNCSLKPTKMSEAKDKQIGGSHYKDMKIQPIEYIHGNNLSYIEGCVVKYISRHRLKNGKQDLEKAKHFIDLLIELEYK